ncbi:MAG: phosphate ABC transporter substrate-binding protein PstS [Gemmatimonadales bacterium]|nr:phosphate ABC transporter substrate-binding protein PstS [Gemmatimonadales bacterium]
MTRPVARPAAVLLALCVAALPGAPLRAQVALTGAGSTFFNPLATRWFSEYQKRTGKRINYQSIGSGGGIRQFTQGTVDFGATDGPMNDKQIAAVQGNVAHLPVTLGAVVITYNLALPPGTVLRLDAPTIADIFLGRIISWNDPRIAALNPGISFPKLDILVTHRSDGSGTTYVFTDFLGKASPEWESRVGHGTAVKWPVGLGGKGNEGVTQQVKQWEGALGYVEFSYARANRLQYASLRNAAGAFVAPSLEGISAAAAGTPLAPDTDFRVSIVNAPAKDAYPIASYVWLLARRDGGDPARAATLRDFLAYAFTPAAQQLGAAIGYAPLPASVMALAAKRAAALGGGSPRAPAAASR